MQPEVKSKSNGFACEKPRHRHVIHTGQECGHEREALHLTEIHIFDGAVVKDLGTGVSIQESRNIDSYSPLIPYDACLCFSRENRLV